jgi:glc operon protein GlcG
MSPTTAALLAVFAFAVAAAAQVADRKSLTLDGARAVIDAATAAARTKNAAGVIAVVDDGGSLMALERLDGTFAAGANISIGKARTAALFKRPSRAFEEVIGKGRTAMVALEDFTPLQGGVPLEVDGQIVGGVGVSGAASAQQDEELALAGAAALESGARRGAVAYFDRDAVGAAFAKGAVLFDRGERYMIHASRRDAPGEAEVHTRDTDLIYVQDGTATFVTGGTVVEPRTTAPDEIRGREISGGETRRLARGDVVIVPAGTPHWFSEVTAPFTYYVVKVR